MRIISGKHKSKRIIAPKKLPVRPTTDMAKEALFNILNNYFNFSNLHVLELFAGTGNVSYEFASRGSQQIVCVDEDAGCVAFIKKTSIELNENIIAIKNNVFHFLEKHNQNYDVIFADPPYDLGQSNYEKFIAIIFKNNLLHNEGMLIVEHNKFTNLEHLPHFSFSKSYGGTIFSFFELN